MAVINEKAKKFVGLISWDSPASMILVQDIPVTFPSGQILREQFVNDEAQWVIWVNTAPIGLGRMGISLNEGDSSSFVGSEAGRQVILVHDAEYAFDSIEFDLFAQFGLIATPAEKEIIEDIMRSQGLLLRKNDHNLQFGTT